MTTKIKKVKEIEKIFKKFEITPQLRGWEIKGYKIYADEIYVVEENDLVDKCLKDIIETFRNICPNFAKCYLILTEKESESPDGYIIFTKFEDVHRLHGIIALIGELNFYSEMGLQPHIAYLNEEHEILIIKVYPAASFASAILRSNHVKLTF